MAEEARSISRRFQTIGRIKKLRNSREGENFLSKFTVRTTLLCIVVLGTVSFARAQRSISPYFGFGGEKDRVGTTNTSAIVCPAGQLFDGLLCEAGPTMGGLFGEFGVDFMFKPHLGINAEYARRFSQATFLPGASLAMRPTFYDVNAIWQPIRGKRAAPFLEGGIGAAKIRLYSTGTPLTGVTDRSTFPAGSDTNHFALHGAAGLKFYIRGNLFFKPEFDLHYARHLTDQFGRNLVVGYMIQVGYTFGGR
jgi:hypothetical protein